MDSRRLRLVLVLGLSVLLARAVEARSCPGSAVVVLPNACVGESSVGSVPFCFPSDGGCGSGLVLGIDPPRPPFALTGLHVDGLLGTLPALAFPVLLAPGESIVAEVSVTLSAPGTVYGRLRWRIADDDEVEDREPDDGDECDVSLTAATPSCAGPTPGSPCSGEACVAGACVPAPVSGPCDDGDPCTLGDTCADGVCRPGSPRNCSGDPCAVGAVCAAGACVGGTPVSCADGNPCTVDACDHERGCVHVPSNALCAGDGPCMAGVCDPQRGCVQTPVTGPRCDDGDACTRDDRCAAGACAGRPVECAGDGFACTEERCVAGDCRHVPVDGRCAGDECRAGECRPGAPGADRRGCVAVPSEEGEPCTDDGIACTDDVCAADGCLHVPIDARCAAEGCARAVCAPERADRDARGCVAGEASGGNGSECGEDGDPCTDDVCRVETCVHLEGEEAAACAPVKAPFQKALGLSALTRTLMTAVDGAAAERTPGAGVVASLLRLGRVDEDLQGAAQALAGKENADASAATIEPAALAETPTQQRARIAFTRVLRTPRQVRSFLTIVSEARARAELGRETSRTLRRRGRLLLHGTKSLKGELKRLQQVSQTFAR